jgi:hypothetical protein
MKNKRFLYLITCKDKCVVHPHLSIENIPSTEKDTCSTYRDIFGISEAHSNLEYLSYTVGVVRDIEIVRICLISSIVVGAKNKSIPWINPIYLPKNLYALFESYGLFSGSTITPSIVETISRIEGRYIERNMWLEDTLNYDKYIYDAFKKYTTSSEKQFSGTRLIKEIHTTTGKVQKLRVGASCGPVEYTQYLSLHRSATLLESVNAIAKVFAHNVRTHAEYSPRGKLII